MASAEPSSTSYFSGKSGQGSSKDSGVEYFNFDASLSPESSSNQACSPSFYNSNKSPSPSSVPSPVCSNSSTFFNQGLDSCTVENIRVDPSLKLPTHLNKPSLSEKSLLVISDLTITPRSLQIEKSKRNQNLPSQLSSSIKSNCKLTPDIKPIKTIEEYVQLTSQQNQKDEYEHVVIDLRPFNQYNISRVKNALSICVPSTLLKRSSFNFSNISKTMIVTQQEELDAKLESFVPLRLIFYDANSEADHCSLQLSQIVKKFKNRAVDINKKIEIYYVNQGFQLFTKDKETKEKLVDTKKFKASKSPDQTTFSEFLLPSADPSSQFLMAMKCNQYLSPEMFRDARINIPVLQNPKNLPAWIQSYTDKSCIRKIVANFVEIENSENQRISGSVQKKRSVSGQSNHCSNSPATYNLFGPENGLKNRYPNVLPYEHSRVKLNLSPMSTTVSPSKAQGFSFPSQTLAVTSEGHHLPNRPPNSTASGTSTKRSPEDDYFNANFIHVPQFNEISHYIATQAPLPSTIDDFWRVVWHNQTEVIVSLTNLNEHGMKKSDVYWENSSMIQLLEETENYDGILGLTVRRIELTRKGYKRIVHQLHYTDWPDHGVVKYDNLLKLIDIKNALIEREDSPVLVHCSAGCGRTGTFIAIDVILEAYIKKLDKRESNQSFKTLDIWKTEEDLIYFTVQQLRKQRISMVQSLNQFILCYEALLQYFSQLPVS